MSYSGAVSDDRVCSKCGNEPAGPGGVLCPGCTSAIAHKAETFWNNYATTGQDLSTSPHEAPAKA